MAKYTPIIFLFGILVFIIFEKYLFTIIGALLFSTTVMYWNSDMKLDDPSRFYDITLSFIVFILSVYYALTVFSNNCIIVWLSLSIVGILIFALNTYLYNCQTVKGYSTQPDQTGTYDYFSEGYVPPDNIYHENAFIIPKTIHVCIMHWLMPVIFFTLLLTQYPPKGIKDCFSFKRA
jgi:hypothetical protein